MKTIKHIFIISIIIMTMISCIGEVSEYKSPQGNKEMSLNTLEDIIYDIHLADAILTTKSFIADTANPENDTLIYENIFLKYNCTRTQFEETLLYYSQNHIDSLNMMYDKIFERFNMGKEKNR